jgi:hypothetical protein
MTRKDCSAEAGGKRFLPRDGATRPLRLVDSKVTTTGAIVPAYETAGNPAATRTATARTAVVKSSAEGRLVAVGLVNAVKPAMSAKANVAAEPVNS